MALTHNLAESWNRSVIFYFRAITSVGNPGGCMPGLVVWDNRPFHIARFRSCGPALARFTRVVDAISAKRLSFREVWWRDRTSTRFQWLLFVLVREVDCLASFQVTMAAFWFITCGILCSWLPWVTAVSSLRGLRISGWSVVLGEHLVLRFTSTRIKIFPSSGDILSPCLCVEVYP